MASNPNVQTDKKKIRSGLYIYKTGRSKNWQVQLWDIQTKKYVRRSTYEVSKIEATKAAIEFADNYRSEIDPNMARSKDRSFEAYAKRFDAVLKASVGETERKYKDYHQYIFRAEDGLLSHFGKFDISKISTGHMRDYLAHLDARRKKPLASGTKQKHIMVIRAILRQAFEDNDIERIPDAPKIAAKDKPRIAFTDDQYKRFIKAGQACAARGDKVSGVTIRAHHIHMFRFLVHSFVRPTEGELFGLRHKDMWIKGNPTRLEMIVRKGKTGLRESFTMPFAVATYRSSFGADMGVEPKPDEYVFLPEFAKRGYARTVASRIFRHIIQVAHLDKEDEKLTTYSLRHYALQKRVRDSNSKVDRHILAKNAGTSVEMLERFYLSRMTPSTEIIERFQSND